MSKSMPAVGSSDAIMTTLAWMRKNGFKPVPLHARSKAATNRNYTDLNYRPPDDALWKGADLGLGVVLGPQAGGPVDVDLDCAEAVFFAPYFLPPTSAIFGRKGKPASHYLYRVTSATCEKLTLNDPVEKGTMLELRADGGHQTVMPGSIHQDTGELIQWHKVQFPDVPQIEPDVLIKGVRKVAAASLIARHMWLDGQRNAVCLPLAGMLYYLDWPEEETMKLIEGLSVWCGETGPDEDKTRRLNVIATYKKAAKGAKITGATTLRKFLGDDRLVDRLLEWLGNPALNLMQEYNERFAVVNLEGKFRVADFDVNTGEMPIFYQKVDFLNMVATDYVEFDGEKVSKGKVWLSNPQRRTFRSVEFLPGVEDPKNILNLWTGWSVLPAKGKCEAWLELLNRIVCGGDEELTVWMLNWFANILREPRDKPLTAPVIIGRQGAGKSLLLAYFGRILGPGYTVITNEDHIYGRFNRHLATTLLLHSEEALYGGEKRHRGIIKSLITDEFRIFEQKGVDARQVRNYLRLVLTSNEAHAAPAESGDRRFTVIDMAARSAEAELVKSVLKEMNADGPAALFYFLNKYSYDAMIPRQNIHNEALGRMKITNFSPMEDWWKETLMTGYMLPHYLSWAQKPTAEKDPWPAVVGGPALYMSMTTRLNDRGQRVIPGEGQFATYLDKFTNTKLVRSQRQFVNPFADEDMPPRMRTLNERQYSIINMPSLKECRQSFEDYIGQPIEWPTDMPEEEKSAYEKSLKF